MDLILLFIISFLVGWFSHGAAMFKKILANPDEMIRIISKLKTQEMEQKSVIVIDNAIAVKVEKYNDHYYLYSEKDNEFLSQGSTLQEAMNILEKRFPNKKFQGSISKEKVEEFGIKI